jgi:hypothetical protein
MNIALDVTIPNYAGAIVTTNEFVTANLFSTLETGVEANLFQT